MATHTKATGTIAVTWLLVETFELTTSSSATRPSWEEAQQACLKIELRSARRAVCDWYEENNANLSIFEIDGLYNFIATNEDVEETFTTNEDGTVTCTRKNGKMVARVK